MRQILKKIEGLKIPSVYFLLVNIHEANCGVIPEKNLKVKVFKVWSDNSLEEL